MPDLFFYIVFFVLGTIIGSFLNVVILRYNTGVSVARGRSFCFSCGKKLGFFELVPVISFLLQKGKCRGCKSKISWQYPTVEFLTGVMFVLVFLKSGIEALVFIIVSLLIAITVYDIKHKIIPDGLVFAFAVLSIVHIFTSNQTHWVWFLLAGPLLALPLFLLWLCSKGAWMGLGDPKLVLGIGFFLGPIYGLSAIVLAFWAGAIYGLILMLLSKMHKFGLHISPKSELPFAPFLILGFLLVFFFNWDVFGLAFML
jgi:prepilin signal peptidase PulO-like enzyme (type II secretory pathway)